MSLSPFLKNSLWIAPVSLLLAWATPRSENIPDQKIPTTEKSQSSRTLSTSTPLVSTTAPELTSVADCQKSLADLEARSDLHPLIRAALRDHALRTWLDLDPAGALALAEKKVVTWGERFGKELFRVWIDLDPESALTSFKLASPALRDSLFVNFYKQLADLDPQRILGLMVNDRSYDEESLHDPRGEVYAHAYQNWAAHDPIAALEHYRQTLAPKSMLGYSTWPLGRISQTWAENDPLAAWQYYKTTEKNAFGPYSHPFIWPALAPAVLTKYPHLIDDHEMRPEIASEQWADADLQGALDFADSLPKDHLWRAHLLVHAAERLSHSDPARALSLYLEGQNSPAPRKGMWGGSQIGFPDAFYHGTFQVLNTKDPAQAHELLQSVPEKHRALALGGILTQQFASDPAAAIETARDYYQDPATSKIIAPALSRALEWGGQNPTEIISAIPEARQLVKRDLLESWTRKDPEAAAAFISEELTSNPTYQPQSPTALSELAAARPEFTADWLHTLPSGPVQTDAAVALAANWATFDQPATEAWISTLTDGPIKEAAMKAFANPSD